MGVLRGENETLNIRFPHTELRVIGTGTTVTAAHGTLVMVRGAEIPSFGGGSAGWIFEFLIPTSEALKGAGGITETRVGGVVYRED